jgi:hypothetical protein
VAEFALRFPQSEVGRLAERFSYPKDDEPCVRAGAAARARGYYTQGEFLMICAWKTGRSRSRVENNDESTVRSATQRALAARSEAERIEALLSLAGVGVPTASALLYFAFPDDYPILDVRALESLGQPTDRTTYSVSYWLSYLDSCRALAKEAEVPIRTLDKALWQASKEGIVGV